MLIAAAAQTNWKSPRLLTPLLLFGRRSYEVYLTHMFAVFALFHLFLLAGKPLPTVPFLFLAVIIVARYYSEPLNRIIRARWRAEPGGSRSIHRPDRRNRFAEKAPWS
jgi:peptidoglycan/LPS O-acetylase OafA/YrhL